MKTFLNFLARQAASSIAPSRLVYKTPEEALKEMADATTAPTSSSKPAKVNKLNQAMLNIEKKKAGIFSRGLWATVNIAKSVKARVMGDVAETGHQALAGVVKSNIEKATAEKLANNGDPLKNIEDKAVQKLLALDKKGNKKLVLARMRATVIADAIHQVDAAITSLEARKGAYGDAIESLKAGKSLDKKIEDLQLRKDILESLQQDNDQKIDDLHDAEKYDGVRKYDALIREIVDHANNDRSSAILDEALRENSVGESKKLQDILNELLKSKKISEQDYKTATESAKLLRAGFRGLGKTARLYYADNVRNRTRLDYTQFDTSAGIPLSPIVLRPNFVNAITGSTQEALKGQLITINDTAGGRKLDAVVVKRDDASHSLLLADRKNKHQFYSISLNPTNLEFTSYNSLNKATATGPLDVPCMVEEKGGKLERRREYKDPSRVYLTI